MDLHWTQNPRFSHLRTPPVWYNRYPEPLYSRKPSSVMEKLASSEARAKWQWEAIPGSRDVGFIKSCVTALLWPCGAYARTSSRLHCALAGHNVETTPDPGFINPDCAQFGGCCPFYGCFLARMQTTVRSFYGIDGSAYSDWANGCCCPCLTLVRNEREILVREKQRQLGSPHDPSAKYQSQSPMTCDQLKTFGGSPASPPKDGKKGKANLASTSDQDAKGNDGPLGRNQNYRDQPLAIVPHQAAHELATDATVPSAPAGLAHGLDRDATTAQTTTALKHGLGEDAATTVASASRGHRLADDAATATGHTGTRHGLATDRPVTVGRPGTPHGLVDDAASAVGPGGGGAHRLSRDATVPSGGQRDGRHGLGADEEVPVKTGLGGPHDMAAA
ncbi:hypothetical protein CDD80_7406 [Ophiocordyceps camponoti-rufipedis]|uniref:Uncharacterized protein n=1 Tax=Ophiocordyceps camponoti-rufipedis TaxID=2004952 RepID=A0A2C5YM69_9HYPO|nr:hypothetical protein CDD80_7406 [Ophiocordyceps camponoti-rufipedis]